ncbi:MAG TPA: Cro/CI family transcriptional regulator [Rhabdochlamydiaceae bacterium]|jgi:hypothetical protein
MTIDEVLTYFGHRQTNVARALGINKQTVHSWWMERKIPYDKQCVIQVHTDGALKACRENEVIPNDNR